jgi:5-methyltetrahydrofolate--homocysteine methyltransferase
LTRERILVFDGAMGTRVQTLDLTAEDFGGEEQDGCNEYLAVTKPESILELHRDDLRAGADFLKTDSFGGTPLVLAEFGLADRTVEINRAAARIARQAAAEFDGVATTRYVAGSMGPTTRSISVTGGVTFDEMVDHYAVQARGLIEGGADLLLLETVQDVLNAKAGIVGIRTVLAELGVSVPIMVSCTIEAMGTTLAGQSVEAVFTSLEHAGLCALGLNCATGPKFMTDHLRSLSNLSDLPTSVVPNAGLPDGEGCYHQSPEEMATTIDRFIQKGWVNIVGGCCGTTSDHIRLLADVAEQGRPRTPEDRIPAAVSGVDYLPLDDYTPVIVGERTNVIGSRAFKQLIAEGDLDGAAEIGQRQVRQGAHILDVCLADPDRDELTGMESFMDNLVRKVRVPLMIDTTDPEVLEASLKRCQGKGIVNSINLEDGEERFEQVVPIIKANGAAVIVGCIDEDAEAGMARTRQRKVEIALRSHQLLTGKYGLPERDLIFDALVFPIGTGDRTYADSAVETIEGVKAIKSALPGCRTILGISNVSFGLPPAGREVLNAAFLHLNLQNGLDMAIVNSERLLRVTQIPDNELSLCEDLLFDRGNDPLGVFVSQFRDKVREVVTTPERSLPLEERLSRYVVEGYRDGLIEDLEEARSKAPPLEIVNGPLMAGMAEVGRLFNNNELIVAEVLQSAEVMKAAVSHLEPHMEKDDATGKGTMLLATVKGDVHDIGKNLVDIIFTNNGYRVVNLGIKVSPQELVRAAAENDPDLIGLSGLLVKSAQQMVVTAGELRAAGIGAPLLVGGAALTRGFTEGKIAPAYGSPTAYARDAMDGLALADRLSDDETRGELIRDLAERARVAEAAGKIPEDAASSISPEEIPPGGGLDHTFELPEPPDLAPHVLEPEELDLGQLFEYVNPTMLYGKHLGLKGRLEEQLERGEEKAVELHEQVEKLKSEIVTQQILRPRGVYRFFRAVGEGNDLILLDPSGRREEGRFSFLRQREEPYRCLSDYARPRESHEFDNVALFVVTTGHGVRDVAAEWKEEGAYLRSHALQALALETAEAFAEWLHQRIREMWGFADPGGMTMGERFKARYRGIRVSFGYPACPHLEDQEQLFRLLDAEARTDVELTEGYMMDPEASVSALVFHHPAAEYFSVD